MGKRRALVTAGGYVAGYAAGRIIRKAATRWVISLFDEIDQALADIDFGDVSHDLGEPTPADAVAPLPEPTPRRMVTVCVPVLLDNADCGYLPMTGMFAFYESDPLAVSMTLTVEVVCTNGHVGSDSTTWGFALDLLDTALSRSDGMMVGTGDVVLQLDIEKDLLAIYLKDTQGRVHRLDIPEVETLREFMVQALAVQRDRADDTIDNAIESLLSGTWEK